MEELPTVYAINIGRYAHTPSRVRQLRSVDTTDRRSVCFFEIFRLRPYVSQRLQAVGLADSSCVLKVASIEIIALWPLLVPFQPSHLSSK